MSEKIYLKADSVLGITHDEESQNCHDFGRPSNLSVISHYDIEEEKGWIENILDNLDCHTKRNNIETYHFSVNKEVYDYLKTIYGIN